MIARHGDATTAAAAVERTVPTKREPATAAVAAEAPGVPAKSEAAIAAAAEVRS